MENNSNKKSNTAKARISKSLNRVPLPNKPANMTILILSGLLVVSLSYYWGFTQAKNKYHKDSTKTAAAQDALSRLPFNRPENENYWSIVGTVQEITSSTITVKNNKGKVETASFQDGMTVKNNQDKSANELSAIVVGQEVIVVGNKEDKQNTARIITIKKKD